MAKYVMFSSVSGLLGFSSLLDKGLVGIDKKTLLIKKQGTFVKLPIEKIDEFKEYVAKFATAPEPVVETPVPVVATVVEVKHFTPSNVDYNKTPMSQMRIGSKGVTAGIILSNSNGAGFYMHSVSSISSILNREDKVSVKDIQKIVKLLSYANKNFLSLEQYSTAIEELRRIYKGASTDLCKRIIKSLWVNPNL